MLKICAGTNYRTPINFRCRKPSGLTGWLPHRKKQKARTIPTVVLEYPGKNGEKL